MSISLYVLNKLKIKDKEVLYFTVPKNWYSYQEFGPADKCCIVINRVGVYDIENKFIKWAKLEKVLKYFKTHQVIFE